MAWGRRVTKVEWKRPLRLLDEIIDHTAPNLYSCSWVHCCDAFACSDGCLTASSSHRLQRRLGAGKFSKAKWVTTYRLILLIEMQFNTIRTRTDTAASTAQCAYGDLLIVNRILSIVLYDAGHTGWWRWDARVELESLVNEDDGEWQEENSRPLWMN